jgi:dihydroflavonol-4-reductase
MSDNVMVSGGNGYIAGFVIRQLIADGWTVRTTIRDLAKEQSIRDLLSVDNDKVSFFKADLNVDAGWKEAVAGCSHVIHTASPIPAAPPKHENDLIVPARDGTLRVLRAAKEAGVKRVVMTSSSVAISYGRGPGAHTFTEADWTDINHPDAYAYIRSKAIAERAARDWVSSEGDDLEFCSINPSMVVGPVWSSDFSTSVESIRQLLEGALPGCPNFSFAVVDVRDVADLHVRALTAPNMAGERFIASGPVVPMAEMARILRNNLGDAARKVPTRKLPDFVVKIAALFDPLIKQVVSELGMIRTMDASHARTALGWTPRPYAETIIDSGRSMIALGIIKI